jgi:hypothetical protein
MIDGRRHRLWMLALICGVVIGVTSCGHVNGVTQRTESIADIKRELWRSTPHDQGHPLIKSKEFELWGPHAPNLGRPGNFILSSDQNVYLDDNTHGGLFKISIDEDSISEIGNEALSNPMRIREEGANLFVYDNHGINVLTKDGKAIRQVKSFLKIDDFAIQNPGAYVVDVPESPLGADGNFIELLNAQGERESAMGNTHSFDFPILENRAFVEVQDGKLYACYKFDPLVEVYDLKSHALLTSFKVTSSIFSSLLDLRKDKDFMQPAPGRYNLPRLIAGCRVEKQELFVLLHTPAPEVVEMSLDGSEIGRYVSSETEVLDYFGFDVRSVNNAKQFFVGSIDYASKPSLAIYEASL